MAKNTETKPEELLEEPTLIEEPVEEQIEEASDHDTPPSLDLDRVLRLVESIENDARTLRSLITTSTNPFPPVSPSYIAPTEGGSSTMFDPSISAAPIGFMQVAAPQRFTEDEAIEGTFDGERMLDAQGKSYQVPPNYASKSKLVEGDPLKLYITKEGKYLYKQLGPVERRTVPGVLRMEGNHYVVDTDEGTTYNILTACVTYYISLYNLKPGDKVMIMIPSDRVSKWAVIDNLI